MRVGDRRVALGLTMVAGLCGPLPACGHGATPQAQDDTTLAAADAGGDSSSCSRGGAGEPESERGPAPGEDADAIPAPEGDVESEADAPPAPESEAGAQPEPESSSADLPQVELPARVLADTPIPLPVRVADLALEEASLDVDGKSLEVRVHRGRGVLMVTLAVGAHLVGGKDVEAVATADRVVSGAISGTWGPGEVVLVEGIATIEAGEALATEDTLVVLGEGAELVVEAGASASLVDTWITGGGGDASRTFGHSDSQPMLRVEGSLQVLRGGLVGSAAKAFGTRDASVDLEEVLVALVDTGGEFIRTHLEVRGGHWLHIPDGDGLAEDDDNDGVYLKDALLEGGEPVPSRLEDVVFALGEDDAIDHNGATVVIERAWLEGFRHEGVAASTGGTVSISDTVVRDCEQGIEAGYGSPTVEVTRTLVTGCDVGLRFGDSYDWGSDGQLTVEASVVVGNVENVKNHDELAGGPKPDHLAITCSWVDTPGLDGVGGNVAGVPAFDPATGCVQAEACGTPVGPAWSP